MPFPVCAVVAVGGRSRAVEAGGGGCVVALARLLVAVGAAGRVQAPLSEVAGGVPPHLSIPPAVGSIPSVRMHITCAGSTPESALRGA